jgi:ferric-dicitrate binding protein FerR (iron transport regulator)
VSKQSCEDLDALVNAVIDGYATEDQYDQLNTRLTEDPKARRRYLHSINLHATLIDDRMPANSACRPIERVPRSFPTRRECALAAVAALIIGLIVTLRPGTPAEQVTEKNVDVAPAGQSSDVEGAPAVWSAWHAEWSSDGSTLNVGSAVPIDRRLELRSGLVELRIGTTDVFIQAPAVFELRQDHSLDLRSGQLAARVNGGHGITVHTPHVDVIDRGTVFGVDLEWDGALEVHVFEGAVDVVEATSKNTHATHLYSGDGLQLDKDGDLRNAVRIRANARRFEHVLPTDELLKKDRQSLPRLQDGKFGLLLGAWDLPRASAPSVLNWDLTELIVDDQPIADVVFQTLGGKHPAFSEVQLLQDDVVISVDKHVLNNDKAGFRYRLRLPDPIRDARYRLRATFSKPPSADSRGAVWLKQAALPSETLVEWSSEARENLALNKQVSATATRHKNAPPAKVTDGDLSHDGIWLSQKYPQSCTIDLGKMQNIDGLRLHLWRDGSTYYQYLIHASQDGKAWTSVVDMSRNTLPSHVNGDVHRIVPIEARYMKVEMLFNSHSSTVSVIELQAFGTPAN